MNAARHPDERLLVGGVEVARYVVDPVLHPRHGPRPYLHPVRTLDGTPVTDALPADHVWHLGASLAVPDVNGSNLWGGRTYVRDAGYTWRDDHGRIVHTGWESRAPDRLAHRLEWRDRAGQVLLTERRRLAAVALPGGAWRLDVDYTLTAPADRDVTLGSPATNGRPGGAGYGGFFWRAASAGPTTVASGGVGSGGVGSGGGAGSGGVGSGGVGSGGGAGSGGVGSGGVGSGGGAGSGGAGSGGAAGVVEGEEAVNGTAGPWLALRGTGPGGAAYTLVFTGLGDGDRWFVRTGRYPGVCVAFAFDRPALIPAGTDRRGRHAVIVAGGHPDPRDLALCAPDLP
ncbi:PmoA family protein [Micromonospora costi]|uniref:DUF6807 domain-containing protein n=1 Tax=Micromonospora costi TaxID=1530042 RepID=UPI0033D37BA7